MNIPNINRRTPQKTFDYVAQDVFEESVLKTVETLQSAFDDLRDQDNHNTLDVLKIAENQLEIRVIDIDGYGKPGTYVISSHLRE